MLSRSASSGWLPATILALGAGSALVAYGTSPMDIAIFGAYVALGLAVPGMLLVRLMRGKPAHISEDLTLGLCLGYCLEIGSYLPARALGAPLLFLLWPSLTLVAFAVVPSLRRHWRGSGTRVPIWWSWSLAAILGVVLVYSAGTFFAQHHLVGTDTPYVDMPYHLALIGELRYHVPPAIPYVSGVPLAYHWFFYADAAATSWATGIEPVTLLYRLSGLPMFVAFVVLTAAAARRLSDGWWTGPVAVLLAVFGTVAEPFRWVDAPVFDTQTLAATWISPTNLFGLALFAAAIVATFDLLAADARGSLRPWLLWAIVALGIAGAKASLEPLLIAGLLMVVAGRVISRRRLDRRAVWALAISGTTLGMAAILLFRGSSGGLTIGLDSLRSVPIIAALRVGATAGRSSLIMAAAGLLVSLMLWSLLWAGAWGLLVRRRESLGGPAILLLVGIGAGALGATTAFSFPGLSQVYFLKSAAGAFGLLTAAGIAALLPARARYGPLAAAMSVAAAFGVGAVLITRALEPEIVPTVARSHLAGALVAAIEPVLALLAVAAVAWALLSRSTSERVIRHGGAPILVVALVMGFSVPGGVALIASASEVQSALRPAIVADAIAAARWLRDHSDPSDLVATNLHCFLPASSGGCDARHFWVSAYTERHVLVEGWAYTTPAIEQAALQGVSDRRVTFWDQALLTANDVAFSDPSAKALALLRDQYGVRWLFADLSTASAAGLDAATDLRDRQGNYGVYELRQP